MAADLDFTTVVAVDQRFVPVLRSAWRTWVANRPEIMRHPLVVLIDDAAINLIPECESFLNHPQMQFVPVASVGADQREKMLTGFIRAADFVKTQWMLKLDADVIAAKHDPEWCSDKLARVCCGQQPPVFIAPPWGYTKPADAVDRLDAWGDQHPQLKGFARLNLPTIPGSDAVKTPGRIISYVFFGRTDWLRWAASLAPERLPVPSQDTYHWYLARRTGKPWAYLDAKKHGWQHGKRNIEENSDQIVRASMNLRRDAHYGSLPALLKGLPSRNPLVGVEIGVQRGRLSAALLSAFPNLILHMVDPWEGRRASGHHLETIRNVAFAWPRTRMWRMRSNEAVKHIPDGQFDFGFIDAAHDYASVAADLAAWWSKIRPGGWLLGHDYGHPHEGQHHRGEVYGVKRAVDEFAARIGQKVKIHPDTVFQIVKPG